MNTSKIITRALSTSTKEIRKQSLNAFESGITGVFGTIISPTYLLGNGWFSVPKNHKAVVTAFGKYMDTLDEGLQFKIPISLYVRNVFMGSRSYKLPSAKIVDLNGNPLIVSAIFNYHVSHPERYVFNIEDKTFVHNQAEAILKKVVAKYPYESTTGEASLKDETDEVNTLMKSELQNLLNNAGVEVDEFYLTDLNYAPEISQQMLIRQQAKAYVDAKREISTAGVEIVNDTLGQLAAGELSKEAKEKLIVNLLTVVTSGSSVTPTIAVDGVRA